MVSPASVGRAVGAGLAISTAALLSLTRDQTDGLAAKKLLVLRNT